LTFSGGKRLRRYVCSWPKLTLQLSAAELRNLARAQAGDDLARISGGKHFVSQRGLGLSS